DPDLHRFIGGAPSSLADLRARYQRLVDGSPETGVIWCNWVIRLGEELVGTVQATVAERDGSAEVAWVVGIPWQGRGIATEAARGLVTWLQDAGVRRMVAHIHPTHIASARVAASVGMKPTDRWHEGEVRWELARE
ncbi:MAG TPA: GNAT family N-acetyltransferase, partial [Marmoricola sp.]